MYLCSTGVRARRTSTAIDPFDPAIAIDVADDGPRRTAVAPILSAKDAAAPSVDEATASGLLPTLAVVERYISDLA